MLRWKRNKRKTSKISERAERKLLRRVLSPRVGVIVLFSIFLVVLVSPGLRISEQLPKVGDIFPEPILARVPFNAVDLLATEHKRKVAFSSVPPVYVVDGKTVDDALQNNAAMFDTIWGILSNDLFSEEEKRNWILQKVPPSVSQGTIELLADPGNYDILKLKSSEVLSGMLKQGILADQPINASEVSIIDRSGDAETERLVLVAKLVTLPQAKKELRARFTAKYSDRPQRAETLYELALPYLTTTLIYDEEITSQRRQRAYESAPPVILTFKRNQEIVPGGHAVTAQDVEELWAHAVELRNTSGLVNRLESTAGNALLLAVLMGAFIFYLYSFRPKLVGNDRHLLLVGLIFVFILLTARVILSFGRVEYPISLLIPVGAGAILLAIMLGSAVALSSAMVMSTLVAVMNGQDLKLFIVAFLSSFVGVLAARSLRKRSDMLRTGLWVSGGNIAVVLALNLVTNSIADSGWEYVFGLFNGMIVAAVVLLTSSSLENLFEITTDFRLLELSDLNHPILKRLALEAPGTYHHSMAVGTMSEAAAETIGANPFMARVGSYYHDIGKLTKPLYYTENQGDVNRHDDLSPNLSSRIITSHIKEGTELADKYNLGKPIADIVRQHHGTSLNYFYQKALETADTQLVDEENFRYPGPRPQTKEAAIVLLADGVEAASRSLANPTPGRVKGLTERIINNKFIDRQLDECELSFKDLDQISKSFTRTLAAVLHSRIEYPEEEAASTRVRNGNYLQKPKRKA